MGIVIDVKIDVELKQFLNAKSPILVSIEVGVNVSDSKLIHPKNALAPILVTILPIVILPICVSGTVDAGRAVVIAV